MSDQPKSIITSPTVRVAHMSLSPDLTEKVAAACAISGDDPGAAMQKAIKMYCDAVNAHKQGLFVGIAKAKEALINLWVIF